jgi:chemotaxis protein MotB
MRMARKEKAQGGGSGIPAWMITFSDLMTLLLTFFVLLVSMAVMDQQRVFNAVGSITTTFGAKPASFSPLSRTNKDDSVSEPGPMDAADLSPLKDMLWEDPEKDLKFQENRFVQIVSINSEVLFAPGTSALSEGGKDLLNRMLPTLLRIKYPLLVAGHTANRRDEEGSGYMVSFDSTDVDSTWPLSLARAQSVYQYFTRSGLPAQRLTMEAFGQYRPRFSDRSASGRLQNRRVDIVLDKRNVPEIAAVARQKLTAPRIPGRYFFRNFQFDLDAAPGTGGGTGGR